MPLVRAWGFVPLVKFIIFPDKILDGYENRGKTLYHESQVMVVVTPWI